MTSKKPVNMTGRYPQSRLSGQILLLAMALLLLDPGCAPSGDKKSSDTPPVSVRVHQVAEKEYKIPVRVTGLLGTTTEMKLSFKTGGIISLINVREGSSVEKGHVLAVLDLSEIRAQVNQAKIGLEKANRDMQRAGNLYRDSVATLEQYQNARSAYELAKAQKQIADFNLLHSSIKAPSDGRIQKILVEASELIGPGHPAILFASTEDDWVVRAALADKDIVRFSIGDSALIMMDAFPGASFRAEVTELGSIADPVTGTYETELLIPEAHPQFRTGFFCRAEILPNRLNRSLVLPVEAIQDASDNHAVVFLLEDGRAKKRQIRTGKILEDEVVVLDGLVEGDRVITDGARYLKDGDEVLQTGNPIKNQP